LPEIPADTCREAENLTQARSSSTVEVFCWLEYVRATSEGRNLPLVLVHAEGQSGHLWRQDDLKYS
jgi:hypothetical protein